MVTVLSYSYIVDLAIGFNASAVVESVKILILPTF